MSEYLKANLAQQFVQNADSTEVRAWLDRLLPLVIQKLTKEERIALVKSILRDHLGTLLRGLSASERTELLQEMLPMLLEEFSLQDIDLLTLFG